MRVRMFVPGWCLLASELAFGQTFGSIDGATRDSSGAVVTGVTVSVTNNGTNAVRTAVTNDAGVYSSPSLAPGTYTLPLYTFGDAGRNTIIGPAGFYWDFSTHKSFRMPREGHGRQFRWEAFNSGPQRGEKCA